MFQIPDTDCYLAGEIHLQAWLDQARKKEEREKESEERRRKQKEQERAEEQDGSAGRVLRG